MTRRTELRPEFVTFAPVDLEPGVLYVSMEYAMVLHLCCCGCGNKVVTPLRPERWHLTYDGRSVTLDWSIGNWSFPCQSHYWIEGNQVVWDRPFTRGEIAAVRAEDRLAMERGATEAPQLDDPATNPAVADLASYRGRIPWWRRLLRPHGG